MTKLLIKGTFDHFQVSEASITTYATFQVDGTFHPEYFNGEADASEEGAPNGCALWQRVRPYFYELTRGRYTPLRFRIILKLAPHNVMRLLEQSRVPISPEQIGGLFLNLQFDGKSLSCTSGISLKSFSTDRSLEHAWDDMLEQFFQQNEISYQIC